VPRPTYTAQFYSGGRDGGTTAEHYTTEPAERAASQQSVWNKELER